MSRANHACKKKQREALLKTQRDALLQRQRAFLERLCERQQRLGESDTAFAARLGVSVHLWLKTRKAKQPIHEVVLRGVATQFPDLHPDIIAELASDLAS